MWRIRATESHCLYSKSASYLSYSCQSLDHLTIALQVVVVPWESPINLIHSSTSGWYESIHWTVNYHNYNPVDAFNVDTECGGKTGNLFSHLCCLIALWYSFPFNLNVLAHQHQQNVHLNQKAASWNFSLKRHSVKFAGILCVYLCKLHIQIYSSFLRCLEVHLSSYKEEIVSHRVELKVIPGCRRKNN